ncbi:MAG: hypothetical protein J0H50_07980 [Xanthomonadales bacterium]|nr:hypothetical protein [Xanthomonadales bacterium]
MGDARRPWFDWRAFVHAVRSATQWRLLLLWVVAWWLPTALVSLPLWRRLDELLSHSVHARIWAGGLDGLALTDTVDALAPASGMLLVSGLFGVLLSALLSPLLNGMAVGSALAGGSPGFARLLRDGLAEYPRLFRLLLCSILIYAAAGTLGLGAWTLAGEVAQKALLESTADRALAASVAVVLLLYVLAQVVLEGARAAFMADGGLRLARRALGRGALLLWRRPLVTLAYFLAVSIAGYALAWLLAVLRGHLPRGNLLEFAVAVLLAQLVVLLIGWTHLARMFALAVVARQEVPGPSMPGDTTAPSMGK